MKKSSLIIGLLSILLFGMLVFSARNPTDNAAKRDIFEGVITNINLEPSVLEGTGVYDRSCAMAENGLTNCDAGIQTEKGLLNFNYKHNMQMQPCIAEGDNLEVEIIDSAGKARVTR